MHATPAPSFAYRRFAIWAPSRARQEPRCAGAAGWRASREAAVAEQTDLAARARVVTKLPAGAENGTARRCCHAISRRLQRTQDHLRLVSGTGRIRDQVSLDSVRACPHT